MEKKEGRLNLWVIDWPVKTQNDRKKTKKKRVEQKENTSTKWPTRCRGQPPLKGFTCFTLFYVPFFFARARTKEKRTGKTLGKEVEEPTHSVSSHFIGGSTRH